jgi:hypothetical protein
MRSYNLLLGTGKNLELKQQQPFRQETKAGEDFMISMLVNAVYYFIDCVYILRSKGKHRLVVLHQNTVLHDKYYPSDGECKIAFQKLFKDKAFNEEIQPDWSHFYDPDKRWLAKKQSRLETGNMA